MQNLNKDKLREWSLINRTITRIADTDIDFEELSSPEKYGQVVGLNALLKEELLYLLSSYQQDLIKRIEEIKESVQKQTGSFKYDDCYDDILTIIKDKKIGKE